MPAVAINPGGRLLVDVTSPQDSKYDFVLETSVELVHGGRIRARAPRRLRRGEAVTAVTR